MSQFKYPKSPLAYIKNLVPRGTLNYFTRRGIGLLIKCPFCAYAPPPDLRWSNQKWRDLSAHIAVRHHGKEAVALPKIGAAHGVERSLEALRNSVQ